MIVVWGLGAVVLSHAGVWYGTVLYSGQWSEVMLGCGGARCGIA